MTRSVFQHIDNRRIYYAEEKQSGVPGDENWLGNKEALVLAGLKTPKRRRDWRLGRWTAKTALNGLARPPARSLQEWQVLADPDGAPCPFSRTRIPWTSACP